MQSSSFRYTYYISVVCHISVSLYMLRDCAQCTSPMDDRLYALYRIDGMIFVLVVNCGMHSIWRQRQQFIQKVVELFSDWCFCWMIAAAAAAADAARWFKCSIPIDIWEEQKTNAKWYCLKEREKEIRSIAG